MIPPANQIQNREPTIDQIRYIDQRRGETARKIDANSAYGWTTVRALPQPVVNDLENEGYSVEFLPGEEEEDDRHLIQW